jgi:membrane peptidoglycan carboxypeptidase
MGIERRRRSISGRARPTLAEAATLALPRAPSRLNLGAGRAAKEGRRMVLGRMADRA